MSYPGNEALPISLQLIRGKVSQLSSPKMQFIEGVQCGQYSFTILATGTSGNQWEPRKFQPHVVIPLCDKHNFADVEDTTFGISNMEVRFVSICFCFSLCGIFSYYSLHFGSKVYHLLHLGAKISHLHCSSIFPWFSFFSRVFCRVCPRFIFVPLLLTIFPWFSSCFSWFNRLFIWYLWGSFQICLRLVEGWMRVYVRIQCLHMNSSEYVYI